MTGRNDPCWCGSGKKYKKCHMVADLAKQATSIITPRRRGIKSAEEIEGMRKAGAFNGQLMDYIRPHVKAGVTTEELDKLVYDYTVDHGHTPACLGYHGFPRSLCTSINDVVCHGIPSPKDKLKDGDIVNVDLTTIVDGFHGDSSEMFMIGEVSDEARHVVQVAAKALLLGIEAAQPGKTLRHIAEAIQPYVESEGCSVVRDYTGHGIGREFHEKGFSVLHHITREAGQVTLEPGMTFTIEPMVNVGKYHTVTDAEDGWTVRTKDKSLSAQFEHTILITEEGPEVLTLTPSAREADQWLVVPGVTV